MIRKPRPRRVDSGRSAKGGSLWHCLKCLPGLSSTWIEEGLSVTSKAWREVQYVDPAFLLCEPQGDDGLEGR